MSPTRLAYDTASIVTMPNPYEQSLSDRVRDGI